jgi:DNA-binding Lrp family transcriptional regulator
MIKTYVMVATEPGRTKSVVRALMDVPEVRELHEVFGPYDIVLKIETGSLGDVPTVLATKIRNISGIESTTSLVTFPEE